MAIDHVVDDDLDRPGRDQEEGKRDQRERALERDQPPMGGDKGPALRNQAHNFPRGKRTALLAIERVGARIAGERTAREPALLRSGRHSVHTSFGAFAVNVTTDGTGSVRP
jgi:hypothetical protein